MGSVVIINNKPYKFNNFEKEIMAKRGINAGIVSKRVRGCWELSEALDAPYGMHLKEYREMKQMEKIKQARLERKLERQRKKEAELRRKKPHLFNVPQKHPRGRYACYLMENDIFVKVKK
ncbi:TPA: SA1788 family PVL leukocidin-associated protein [Staphylococcus aureus]